MTEPLFCIAPNGVYCGPPGMRRRYQFGEQLREGVEPNEFFVPKHRLRVEASRLLSSCAGDDPRPTEQIRSELKTMFGIELPENATRKELWKAWDLRAKKEINTIAGASPKQAEVVIESPGSTAPPVGATAPPSTQQPAAGLNQTLANKLRGGKLFSHMTPDDIHKTTARDLVDILAGPPYNLKMSHVGVAKTDIVARGMDIEQQMGLVDAPKEPSGIDGEPGAGGDQGNTPER
jgi:hypothetical protein